MNFLSTTAFFLARWPLDPYHNAEQMDDTPTPIAEIDHGPSKFEVFLDENQKSIIALAIAIFLGVLGYVGYTSYADLLAAKAGEALTAAEEESELQAVISEHGNTNSAGSAALLIAQIKGSESSEEAIATLQDFVATYPAHPAISTATTSLGLRLLNEGKLDQAEAQLTSVVDMENADFIIPAAQIALGDIAKQKGDNARAKELYTEVTNLIADTEDEAQIVNITKYSPYKTIASARLRFLEAAAPKAVEKKAPVETPALDPTPAVAPQVEISAPKEKDEKNSQPSE